MTTPTPRPAGGATVATGKTAIPGTPRLEKRAEPAKEPSNVTSQNAPAKPDPVKTEPTGKPALASLADLPPAQVEPETGSKYSSGLRIDVEKEIPQALRDELENKSFKPYMDKLLSAKPGEEPPPAVWLIKPCGTRENAEAYVAAMKRYGKYRPAGQITVRGAVTKVDPTVARVSAKPLESRAPKNEKTTPRK